MILGLDLWNLVYLEPSSLRFIFRGFRQSKVEVQSMGFHIFHPEYSKRISQHTSHESNTHLALCLEPAAAKKKAGFVLPARNCSSNGPSRSLKSCVGGGRSQHLSGGRGLSARDAFCGITSMTQSQNLLVLARNPRC